MRSARSKGLIDEDYKAWVRSLPCAVCRSWNIKQSTPTECAHVGLRGMSQKCSDRETLPLCVRHHEHGYKTSHHTLGKNFWNYHGINREALIKWYNDRYERENGKQKTVQAK